MNRYTLEQIASAELIARSTDTSRVREILATIEPSSYVTDGEQTCSFEHLMLEHKDSGCEGDPWSWAFSDLVFGGFDIAEVAK